MVLEFIINHVFPRFRSLSYGAIGHVLGHELTHGFDTTGENVHVIRTCFVNRWSYAATSFLSDFSVFTLLNLDCKNEANFFRHCQDENLIRTES